MLAVLRLLLCVRYPLTARPHPVIAHAYILFLLHQKANMLSEAVRSGAVILETDDDVSTRRQGDITMYTTVRCVALAP